MTGFKVKAKTQMPLELIIAVVSKTLIRKRFANHQPPPTEGLGWTESASAYTLFIQSKIYPIYICGLSLFLVNIKGSNVLILNQHDLSHEITAFYHVLS